MNPEAKKICVFQVTGVKILGRVGTHIFFLEKIYIILCILKGVTPFKKYTTLIFPENLKIF